MGNNSSKHGEQDAPLGRAGSNDDPNAANAQRPSSSARSRNRTSRGDFNLIPGFAPPRASASQQMSQPEQRRETRQEREARRRERERIAREKERERSMREEHVDGGFLVTMGIYQGPEDFSKPIVRQLQVRLKHFRWVYLGRREETCPEDAANKGCSKRSRGNLPRSGGPLTPTPITSLTSSSYMQPAVFPFPSPTHCCRPTSWPRYNPTHRTSRPAT